MFALLNRYTELFRKIYGQLSRSLGIIFLINMLRMVDIDSLCLLPQGEETLVCAKLRSLRVERCLLAGLITNQLV